MNKDFEYTNDKPIKTRKEFYKKYNKIDEDYCKKKGRRMTDTVSWKDNKKTKVVSKLQSYCLYATSKPYDEKEIAEEEVQRMIDTFGTEINPDTVSRYDAHAYNLDRVAAEFLIYGMYTNHMDADCREQIRMPGIYFIYGLDTTAIQTGQYELSKLYAKQKHYNEYIFPQMMCVRISDKDNDVMTAQVMDELLSLACIKAVFDTLKLSIPEMIRREDVQLLREHYHRFLKQAERSQTTMYNDLCKDFANVLCEENKSTKRNDAWRSYVACGRAAAHKGLGQKIDFIKYRIWKSNLVDIKTIIAEPGDYTYYNVENFHLFKKAMKKFPDVLYAKMPKGSCFDQKATTIFYNKKWEDIINYVANMCAFRFDGGMKTEEVINCGTYRAVVIPRRYMRQFQEGVKNVKANYAYDTNVVSLPDAGNKGDIPILIAERFFSKTDQELFLCNANDFRAKAYNYAKRPGNMFKKLNFSHTVYEYAELEDIDILNEEQKNADFQCERFKI